MKIVHTYLKTEKGGLFRETILHSMLLSTLLAKKFYGRVELYTDRKTEKIVQEIGIPYDLINSDELDNIELKSYTIPKVYTYSLMNEPFIHIDLDSFIFEKLKELDTKTVWCAYPEGGDELDFRIENRNFYHTYVESAFKIQSKLPQDLLSYIKFSNVPNFCIMGGYQHKIISEASKLALDIYLKFKDHFDSDYYYSIMLEQLLIPAFIRYLLDKNNDIRMDDTTFSFYYKNIPNFIDFENGEDYKVKINSNGEIKNVGTTEEFMGLVNYNFNGFLHLNGYKDLYQLIFLLRQRSIEEFGAIEQVRRIDFMFKKSEKYQSLIDLYNNYKKNNSSINREIKLI